MLRRIQFEELGRMPRSICLDLSLAFYSFVQARVTLSELGYLVGGIVSLNEINPFEPFRFNPAL